MGEQSRPALLVVIGGTGTEVGKTWVTAQLAGELRRRGLRVAARKPAQSFDPYSRSPTDAEILAAATGESVDEVCPALRWYPKAMAPPMAAESMGLSPFGLQELAAEIRWPAGTHAGLVEQAGGVGSPQASDGDGVDLVELLSPDVVVLVAAPGLGTLSNISLAARALSGWRLVVFLNRFDAGDELHAGNLGWLRERLGLAVEVSVPRLAASFGELRR